MSDPVPSVIAPRVAADSDGQVRPQIATARSAISIVTGKVGSRWLDELREWRR
jgi:hypothetical protein